jgi:hypothetical protein
MGPKELRNVVWPLLRQPMPRDEIAHGVAVTYNIDITEAKAVVDQLDEDIRTCTKYINIATADTIERVKENARKAIAPISDACFNMMWDHANFIVSKGGGWYFQENPIAEQDAAHPTGGNVLL